MPPVFWAQRQDIGPSARVGHAMVDDTVRDRVVLFGGDTGSSTLNDTWEWDGTLWTQVADTGPSSRQAAAMAFSPSDARSVLFGGTDGASSHADTWAYDGTGWVQVENAGPAGRWGHAMAYDAGRERVLLFGGFGGGPLKDTWEWDGTSWTQVQDAGPTARYGHVMAYDAAAGGVVLFGGADATGMCFDDTWTWDGANWTQAADTGPAARAHAAVSGGGSILLFGGVSTLDSAVAMADRVVFGDTWRREAGQWAQVQDIGPAPRWGHAMALRVDASRTVLFGGATMDASATPVRQGDTWEVPDSAGSSQPEPGTQPQDGVQVASVQLFPTIIPGPGLMALQVVVQLTGPAVAGSSLTFAIHQVVGGNVGNVVNPSGYIAPTGYFGGGEFGAQFTLVPDSSMWLPYGDYAVMVGLGAGPMQGAAFRYGP